MHKDLEESMPKTAYRYATLFVYSHLFLSFQNYLKSKGLKFFKCEALSHSSLQDDQYLKTKE